MCSLMHVIWWKPRWFRYSRCCSKVWLFSASKLSCCCHISFYFGARSTFVHLSSQAWKRQETSGMSNTESGNMAMYWRLLQWTYVRSWKNNQEHECKPQSRYNGTMVVVLSLIASYPVALISFVIWVLLQIFGWRIIIITVMIEKAKLPSRFRGMENEGMRRLALVAGPQAWYYDRVGLSTVLGSTIFLRLGTFQGVVVTVIPTTNCSLTYIYIR